MARPQENSLSDDQLIATHIEENPFKPGRANAHLIESGMSVWALIGALEEAKWDIPDVAEDYELTPEQIQAAIAFYHRYKDIIEDRRAANRITISRLNDGAPLSR